MPLTIEQIQAILKLIDESSCEEFRLETDGLKLVVLKRASGDQLPAPAAPARPRPAAPEPARAAPAPSARVAVTVPQGVVAVRAPMVGTFYRAPAPGAPPFVEVGSVVKETDTVGILEVMKLMNSIAAGVRGRVVRVCVENATLVEFGQPLILIAPDATHA